MTETIVTYARWMRIRDTKDFCVALTFLMRAVRRGIETAERKGMRLVRDPEFACHPIEWSAKLGYELVARWGMSRD